MFNIFLLISDSSVAKKYEIDCDFDNGFCGWSQASNDGGVNWQLGRDYTPSGRKNYYYTGPRKGISKESADGEFVEN